MRYFAQILMRLCLFREYLKTYLMSSNESFSKILFSSYSYCNQVNIMSYGEEIEIQKLNFFNRVGINITLLAHIIRTQLQSAIVSAKVFWIQRAKSKIPLPVLFDHPSSLPVQTGSIRSNLIVSIIFDPSSQSVGKKRWWQ